MTDFFKTQKDAFEYADKKNYNLIITRKNIKGTFDFSAIREEDYLNFISHLEKINEDITKFSTMIRENQEDRLRLDIEIYVKTAKDIKKAEKLLNELLEDIKEYCNIDITDYIISDNSRKEQSKKHKIFKYKYSKHLLFNYYFSSIKHQKQYWTNFLKEYPEWENIINDDLLYDFDKSVYNNNSQWNETKRKSENSLVERCPTIINKNKFKKIDVEIIEVEEKKVKKSKEEDEEEKEAIEETKTKIKNDSKMTKDLKSEVIELCNMLSYNRINNYDSWKDLIFCLSNISASNEMKKIAIQISKQSDKSNDKEFDKTFNKLWSSNTSNKKLGIGSLYYWAKNDNEQEYKIFIHKKLNDFSGECLLLDDDYNQDYMDKIIKNDNSHMGIAKLIKKMISGKVKFINKSIVYRVDKYNVWIKEGEYALMNLISNDIIYRLTKYYYENIHDENKNEKLESVFIKMIMIKDGGEITKILKFLIPILNDVSFMDLLDNDPDLFAFNDKVVNLKTKEVRSIKPTDYISITTGYNYPTEKIKYKEAIDEYFKKVYPDEEQRNYILNHYAQSLSGRVKNNWVNIHSGKNNSGGNAKTSTFTFLNRAFGKYAYAIPADLFCGKQDPNPQAPRPDIIHLKGKRLIYTSEPDEREKLNAKWIKLLSGGDRISARLCNSNDMIEFNSTIHLNILCNQLLAFNGSDGGMSRRLKVIEYKSRFIHDEKIINKEKNIYLVDPDIEDNFKKWRNDFIRLLIDRYNDNYKYYIPEVINNSSQKYFSDNDQVSRFAEKHIKQGPGNITIQEIKDIWKNDSDFEPIKHRDLIADLKRIFQDDFHERKKINRTEYRNILTGFTLTMNDDNNDDEQED